MWYRSAPPSPPVHPPVHFFYFLSCPVPNIHSCTALLLSCLFLSNKVHFLSIPIYLSTSYFMSCLVLPWYLARSCFVIVYTFLSCRSNFLPCPVCMFALAIYKPINLKEHKSLFFFFKWGLLIEPFRKSFSPTGCDFVLKKIPESKFPFSTLTSSSPHSDDSERRRPSRASFVKTFSTQFLSGICWIKSSTRVGIINTSARCSRIFSLLYWVHFMSCSDLSSSVILFYVLTHLAVSFFTCT